MDRDMRTMGDRWAAEGNRTYAPPGEWERSQAIEHKKMAIAATGHDLGEDYARASVDAEIMATLCALARLRAIEERPLLRILARDAREGESAIDTLKRLASEARDARRYESGEAEQAVRKALGAADSESTVGAAKRVVRERDAAEDIGTKLAPLVIKVAETTGERPADGVHELKCWPEFFKDLATERLRFCMRRDDRGGYQVGDMLHLREYDPERREYTGNFANRRVTYVMRGGQHGIAPGYVVLGLDVSSDAQWDKLQIVEGRVLVLEKLRDALAEALGTDTPHHDSSLGEIVDKVHALKADVERLTKERDFARDANRDVGNEACARGMVHGLQRAVDILIDVRDGGDLVWERAWDRITEARTEAIGILRNR